MNRLSKKILSALIAAGTFASCAPAFAALPEDVAGTAYEDPVQVLSALKIMNGDENGKFRLDDTIIRSEVAKMAVHAIGLDEAANAAKGNSKFSDVGTDHWANGYIDIATQQGLIEGDGDGKFRPNDPINYSEAMAIMTRAVGYDVSARGKGGYPNGYVSVGTSIGLAKNVKGSMLQPISRGNVAYMTKNALEAKMMEQTGYGSNTNYEITDKTLMEEKLNVTKYEGQVEAVEKSAIKGNSSLSKGQVRIDGKTYNTAYNMNGLLGYKVNYYVKENDNGVSEIILAMPVKNQNKELVVKADDFSRLTTKNSNTAIEYYTTVNNTRTSVAELAPDYNFIYNGKSAEKNNELLNIADKSGKIIMLDTDRDGKYDVVSVTVYENMVVGEVTASGKIVDKYSAQTLKLEDVDYRITKGLEEIDVKDLKEYDVLTIAKSLDGELYDIIVTNDTVEGKITGTDKDGVFVDGKHYEVAANYTETLKIGTESKFYLDAEGKIAAADNAVSRSSSGYAYLTSAYTDEGRQVSIFKMFTKSGEEAVITANAKVKFNNRSGVKAEDVVKAVRADGATVKQLVTYSVNSDGKLTALNTANDSSGAVNENEFTRNYSLQNAEYNAAQSKLGNVRINSETIIFNIDEKSDDYSVETKDIFEDEQRYDAFVYDMTENYTAKVIVLTNSAVKASADSKIAVVMSIAEANNDEDEQTDLMTALVDGEEVSAYAKDGSVLVKNGKKLAEGDVIQYKTNADGEIVSYRMLLDMDAKDTEAKAEPIENLVTVYGKVTKKFDNSINVTVNGENDVNYELPSDMTVYSVDTTITKNRVSAAQISDIQSFDEDEGNRIFLKIYKDVVTEAVIVK